MAIDRRFRNLVLLEQCTFIPVEAYLYQAPDRAEMTASIDPHAVALLILKHFERAQQSLAGASVLLSNGVAGTIERIFLDELHGLRLSVHGHEGEWPISTVRLLRSAR